MNHTNLLDEALALALKLAPKERLQLIEQVAPSVERELDESPALFTQKTGRSRKRHP